MEIATATTVPDRAMVAQQIHSKAPPTMAKHRTTRTKTATTATTVRTHTILTLAGHGKTPALTVPVTTVEREDIYRNTVPSLTSTALSATPEPMIQQPVGQNQKPAHHWNRPVQVTTTLLLHPGHTTPPFHLRNQTSMLSQIM